ncbi:hypothetical protein KL86DES1_20090 [uncultured Desulfovibrio sp.]|uniref:Lipoprotein n=2 Tax=Desulfovibrio TaxID=872 RepID=A0A212L2P5_9BACT|nr:hypothetical protein KL86DES1_20090 [uncultured Desulfovibrio sp.]VZH32990.1 conserved protein of unknown function [Desulfovibrio sp. 86]
MRTLTITLLVLLTLGGCTKRLPEFGPPEFGTLERGQIVYITIPGGEMIAKDDRRSEPDAPRDYTRYPDIETQIARMLQKAIAPYTTRAIISDRYEPWPEASKIAKANNARYLIYLTMQIGKSHLYLEREKVRRLFLLISIMDLDSNALSRTTVMYITFRDLNPQDVTPEVLNNVQSGFDSRAKLLFEGKPSSNTLP